MLTIVALAGMLLVLLSFGGMVADSVTGYKFSDFWANVITGACAVGIIAMAVGWIGVLMTA